MTSCLHLSRQVEPKSLIPRGIAHISHCRRHDQAQDPGVTIAQTHSSHLRNVGFPAESLWGGILWNCCLPCCVSEACVFPFVFPGARVRCPLRSCGRLLL